MPDEPDVIETLARMAPRQLELALKASPSLAKWLPELERRNREYIESHRTFVECRRRHNAAVRTKEREAWEVELERRRVLQEARGISRRSAHVPCEHGHKRSFCPVEGCHNWGGREAGAGDGFTNNRW